MTQDQATKDMLRSLVERIETPAECGDFLACTNREAFIFDGAEAVRIAQPDGVPA